MRDLFEAVEDGAEPDPMAAARRAMAAPLPKRFYQSVTTADVPGGHAVQLDGRVPRTPRGAPLVVPTAGLAAALAAEWQAQRDVVDPATMPLTRLVAVTIDGVVPDPAPAVDEIVRYAASDLVCYRAGDPASLVARQAAHWDPVLEFARGALGARFVLSQGIVYVTQPEPSLAAVRRAVEAVPPFALAALATATALTGSALIALAVAHGSLSAEAGWAAAHVDEDWQIEQWGEDAHAAARRAHRKAEWDAAVTILRACAAPGSSHDGA